MRYSQNLRPPNAYPTQPIKVEDPNWIFLEGCKLHFDCSSLPPCPETFRSVKICACSYSHPFGPQKSSLKAPMSIQNKPEMEVIIENKNDTWHSTATYPVQLLKRDF